MLIPPRDSLCELTLKLIDGLKDEDGLYKSAAYWFKQLGDVQVISQFQDAASDFHRSSQLAYIEKAPHLYVEKANFYRAKDDALVHKMLVLFDMSRQEALFIKHSAVGDESKIGLVEQRVFKRIKDEYGFDIQHGLQHYQP
jgi:hypothetical protein